MPFYTDIQDVLQSKYDFIVIGAGPAGCVMASRLSEDPSTNVLLLEAGKYHSEDDPLIVTPAFTFSQFHNPGYDWVFQTTPESAVNNRTLFWNRGKGLGGCTNMNLMHWTYPSSEDIDSWERLGNPGWNFKKLFPYLKKTHTFYPQTEFKLDPGNIPIDHSALGVEGNVPVSYPASSPAGQSALLKAFENIGIPRNNNAFEGDILGLSTAIYTTDVNGKRVSAFSAYLKPHLSRPNLHILTEAIVAKLIVDDAKSDLITSKGVNVIHKGATYQISVEKEVILAAGAIGSPQILELSGIGDKNILSRVGIDVILDLPGVGENLQEHTLGGVASFEIKQEESVKHNKTDEEYAAYFHAFAIINLPIQVCCKEFYQIIEEHINSRKHDSEALKEQFAILKDRLSNPQFPDCEVVIWPKILSPDFVPSHASTQYITLGYFGYSPWSRGQIHVTSKDPLQPPILAANHVEEDIDLKILVQVFKFLRTLKDVPPFSSVVECEVLPGPNVQTDDEIENYILNTLLAGWHASGSLSMLPREKGGVVDPTLKVWGTANIRVVDLSIQPLIMSGHTQALTYAVAEYAADMIRNGL